MTIFVKQNDELDAFPLKGSLSEFASDLNIAAAQGKQFVVMPKLNGKPRMIAVHNISWADEADEDEGSVFG